MKKWISCLLIGLLILAFLPINLTQASVYTFRARYWWGSGTGTLVGAHSDYSNAHNKFDADTIAMWVRIGQKHLGASFEIYRGFVTFDTSALPDDLNIISAVLKLMVSANSVYSNFDIVVQTGNGLHPKVPPDNPNSPLDGSDYYFGYYFGDGGRYPAEMAPGQYGWVVIELNDQGISWINKTGLTKFVLRSSKDINSIPPTTQEYLNFYESEIYLEITADDELKISLTPTFVTMDCNETKVFSCSVSGGLPPYSYKWFVNDNYTGVKASSFEFCAPWEEMGNSVRITCYVGDARGVWKSAQAIAKIKIPKGLLQETGLIRKEYTGIRVELWHVDTNYPYKERYIVYITIDNLWHIEKGNDLFYPVDLQLSLELSDACEEVQHQPVSGDYGSSPISFSLGANIGGIPVGFAITPPRYYVDYHREVKDGKLKITWRARTYQVIDLGLIKLYLGWGVLFYDQVRFFFEFDAPKDYKPAVNINLMTSIYVEHSDSHLLWTEEDTGWISVDPPGASLPPGELIPLISPEKIAKINSYRCAGGATIKLLK